MELTVKQVEHVAKLARIRLRPEETDRLAQDLADITAFAEQLGAMQNGEEAKREIVRQGYRQDETAPSYLREVLIQNAPFVEEGCFLVPKVLE